MKTPAYKITCRSNTDAIIVSNHLEASNINPDERDGDTLFLSKESLDEELIDETDIEHVLEDAAMEYELEYVPEIETEDHEWEEQDHSSSYLRYRDDGGTD